MVEALRQHADRTGKELRFELAIPESRPFFDRFEWLDRIQPEGRETADYTYAPLVRSEGVEGEFVRDMDGTPLWVGWKNLQAGDRVVSYMNGKVLAHGEFVKFPPVRKGRPGGLSGAVKHLGLTVRWDNGVEGKVGRPGHMLRREEGPFEPPEGVVRTEGIVPEIEIESGQTGDRVSVTDYRAAPAAARALWDESVGKPGRPTINFYVGGNLVRTVTDRREIEEPPVRSEGIEPRSVLYEELRKRGVAFPAETADRIIPYSSRYFVERIKVKRARVKYGHVSSLTAEATINYPDRGQRVEAEIRYTASPKTGKTKTEVKATGFTEKPPIRTEGVGKWQREDSPIAPSVHRTSGAKGDYEITQGTGDFPWKARLADGRFVGAAKTLGQVKGIVAEFDSGQFADRSEMIERLAGAKFPSLSELWGGDPRSLTDAEFVERRAALVALEASLPDGNVREQTIKGALGQVIQRASQDRLAAGMAVRTEGIPAGPVEETATPELLAEIERAAGEATNDPEGTWRDIGSDMRRALREQATYRFLIQRKGGKVVGAAVVTEEGPGVEPGTLLLGRIASIEPGAGTALLREAAKLAAGQDKGLIGYAIPSSRGFFHRQGMHVERAGISTFLVSFSPEQAREYGDPSVRSEGVGRPPQPERMFHVAPRMMRDSIEEKGLDYRQVGSVMPEAEAFLERLGVTEQGNYLWDNLDDAL